MHVYVENVKEPSIRFKVVSYDAESKMGKLKGEYGAEFSRDLSKAAMEKFGYKIVKSDKELPLVSSVKVAKPKPKAKKAAKVVEEEEEE